MVEPLIARLENYLHGDALLASIEGRSLSPVVMSDLVRLALLRRHGGIWADATTYCLQPLDERLPAVFGSGFFAFAKPSRSRMVSSWLLAAAPESPLIERWYWAARDYWSQRGKPDSYFWLHELFAQCYASDRAFSAIWDATPQVSAEGPHHFYPYGSRLFEPLGEADRRFIEDPGAPVLKLTHKLERSDVPAGSVLRFLTDRTFSQGPPL